MRKEKKGKRVGEEEEGRGEEGGEGEGEGERGGEGGREGGREGGERNGAWRARGRRAEVERKSKKKRRDANTVEPLYNGHCWDPTFCPL